MKLPYYIFPTENIERYAILTKLGSYKLREVIDDDGIQRGISPDLKEAFLVSDKIVSDSKLEIEKIKPTLSGGVDVKKYQIVNKSKRIIYTSRRDKPEDIPHIIEYLKQFEKEITCKEVKAGKHPFYALHRERDEKIFAKPEKVIGVITGDKIIVAIDTEMFYPTDGLYLFSSNENSNNRYLVGLLNSKFFTFLYRLFSFEQGRALAQVKPSILLDIPIPKISLIEQNIIIEKVKELENQKKFNPLAVTNVLEKEIDQLVYSLYGLTEEEIQVIEGDKIEL